MISAKAQSSFAWARFLSADIWLRDLLLAARMLRKNPGFTAVAVITLALAIGANTAVFSYVNAILLRPLPFRDPERLVLLSENNLKNGWRQIPAAPVVIEQWRGQSAIFEDVVVRGWSGFIITGNGSPENVPGAFVSANTFRLLGLRPLLGRDFLPEEQLPGKTHVALIAPELWQHRFGGDPNILGRSITVDDESYTIVGVMPVHTFFPDPDTQLWLPLESFSAQDLRDRHAHIYMAYGRLKPGVTPTQANAVLDSVARRMAADDPSNKDWGAEVRPMREVIIGNSKMILLTLLGAVAMVLLIGAMNIANLLLVRSSGRQGEFAVRIALGANRLWLARQLLMEGLLLALLGGTGGVVMALFLIRIIHRFSPPALPRVWEGISLDGHTLAFSAGLTLLTGILFSLAPILKTSKPALGGQLSLKPSIAGSSHPRTRFRATIAMGQIALSFILLVSAALMIRTLSHLLTQNLGFNPEHILTLTIGRTDAKGITLEARMRFFETLLARVRETPGLDSAALVRGVPLREKGQISVKIPGQAPSSSSTPAGAGYAQISPGYFHTMGIHLVRGREFDESDRTNTIPVAIVDETFVKNFNLGTNAIGSRINLGNEAIAEVIGVVNDIKRTGLADDPRGEVYRTFKQACPHQMALVLRTRSEVQAITKIIRGLLNGIDRDQAIGAVVELPQLIQDSVGPQRWVMQLLSGFAALAVLLASIGLYGVQTQTVVQRTHEIGIRSALGADQSDVLWMILKQGLVLTAGGLGIGVTGALAFGRVLRNQLYQVGADDPATFIAAGATLTLFALLACYLPARRATKVDPMIALRCE